MRNYVYFIILLLTFNSCKKEAGLGGNASIEGHVTVKDYNNDFSVLISEYDGYDRYVYIKYGGEGAGFDKRVKTDYEGNFIFEFLYPGTYEIYVYGKDNTFLIPSGVVAVSKTIEISDRKENVITEDFVILE
ncbi:MAG: hypothetical protein RL204_535 [Bacteroidota bacterium]|jgi:hypothetical protein